MLEWKIITAFYSISRFKARWSTITIPLCFMYGGLRAVNICNCAVPGVETSFYYLLWPQDLSFVLFGWLVVMWLRPHFLKVRTMEHILAVFCGGVRSENKPSQVSNWFSSNTPLFLRNVICPEFGILPTLDLGSYLGIRLIHGRTNIKHYEYAIEKTSDISLVGRWRFNPGQLEQFFWNLLFGNSSYIYDAVDFNP